MIANTEWNEQANRWGIVLLVFHNFYDDQSGGYSVNRKFGDSSAMLQAFKHALEDDDDWYCGAPKLELVAEPALLFHMNNANYIDAAKGQSALYMALVRKKL